MLHWSKWWEKFAPTAVTLISGKKLQLFWDVGELSYRDPSGCYRNGDEPQGQRKTFYSQQTQALIGLNNIIVCVGQIVNTTDGEREL